MTALEPPCVDVTGPLASLKAPPSWQQIDLLSDLHLSEATPRTVQAFLSYLATSTADAILLLGDVFEVWVGDDVLSLHGFEQELLTAIDQARRSRWFGFMAGNRDFLLGNQACAFAGLHSLPDPLVLDAWGERIVLMHGDALCLTDTDYQTFRSQVRATAWQRSFLAQPLDHRLETGRRMREASEARKTQLDMETYADVDLFASLQILAQAQASVLIHGHTHRPESQTWGTQSQRHVLSDWDFDSAQSRADVLELHPLGIRRRNLAMP